MNAKHETTTVRYNQVVGPELLSIVTRCWAEREALTDRLYEEAVELAQQKGLCSGGLSISEVMWEVYEGRDAMREILPMGVGFQIGYDLEIDTLMVPIVRECWRLGWRTLYCCQSDWPGDSEPEPDRILNAYIAFGQPVAARFRSIAMQAGDPPWACHPSNKPPELRVVRFPSVLIPEVTKRLKAI